MTEPDPWTSTGHWFDRDWYLLRNADISRAGIDPLGHYRRYGEAEGRFPCPWFDPIWYRLAYDIRAGQSPLAHFLTHRAEGRFLPSAVLYPIPRLPPWRDGADPFDRFLDNIVAPEQEVLPDLALLRSSGLIDPAYHALNGTGPHEAELEPALHYCRFGRRLGLRASNAFDLGWYIQTNPSVAREQINPLTHYILEGEAANRRPILWFDPAWYRTRHEIPTGQLALAHYLMHRHAGIVSPNPLFDAPWYVAQHSAAIPPGVDPFSHFLVAGAVSDVDPSPSFNARLWRRQHMAPLGSVDQQLRPVAARNPLAHYILHILRTLGQT